MTAGSNSKDINNGNDRIDMFGRKLPRRFYKHVTLVKTPGGYTVELDGRSIKTPAKNLVEVDTEPVARAIADDWENQVEFINPETMYTCKLANTAIDRIAPDRAAVIAEMVEYADSDFLCYRALEPESLVQRQNDSWESVLAWLDKAHGCRLICVGGIMHQPQPAEAIENLTKNLHARSAMMLAAMHNLTTLTGSVVLALAVADGHLDAQGAWACAHVDEDWQIEQWGHDEEAAANRARRWLEMKKTADLMLML